MVIKCYYFSVEINSIAYNNSDHTLVTYGPRVFL